MASSRRVCVRAVRGIWGLEDEWKKSSERGEAPGVLGMAFIFICRAGQGLPGHVSVGLLMGGFLLFYLHEWRILYKPGTGALR